MDKPDNRFEAAFKEAGGDMNHVEWDDYDGYGIDERIAWPDIGLVVALVASVGGLAWWLS